MNTKKTQNLAIGIALFAIAMYALAIMMISSGLDEDKVLTVMLMTITVVGAEGCIAYFLIKNFFIDGEE